LGFSSIETFFFPETTPRQTRRGRKKQIRIKIEGFKRFCRNTIAFYFSIWLSHRRHPRMQRRMPQNHFF
jgi:hypothetical protein